MEPRQRAAVEEMRPAKNHLGRPCRRLRRVPLRVPVCIGFSDQENIGYDVAG
jgi:hypothetical protein